MTGSDNPGAPASATGVRNTERTSKSLHYIDSTSAREPEALFAVDLVVGRYRPFASSARAELMLLTAGDHVAYQGVMRITSQRLGGDVVTKRHLAADLVVSLRPKDGGSDV
jgi:hypothetical protein